MKTGNVSFRQHLLFLLEWKYLTRNLINFMNFKINNRATLGSFLFIYLFIIYIHIYPWYSRFVFSHTRTNSLDPYCLFYIIDSSPNQPDALYILIQGVQSFMQKIESNFISFFCLFFMRSTVHYFSRACTYTHNHKPLCCWD